MKFRSPNFPTSSDRGCMRMAEVAASAGLAEIFRLAAKSFVLPPGR